MQYAPVRFQQPARYRIQVITTHLRPPGGQQLLHGRLGIAGIVGHAATD